MSLPMQGGRSGGVQFDFAWLKTKVRNFCLCQNSFEPERFARERTSVEHLKPCLLDKSWQRWRTVADALALERRSAEPIGRVSR